MSKGKYAEGARTKREADTRYAMARSEANELRRQIHEIRHLRDENADLKVKMARLREQIVAGTSEELSRAKAEVGRLKEDVAAYQAYVVSLQGHWEKICKQVIEVMPGEFGIDRVDEFARLIGLPGITE